MWRSEIFFVRGLRGLPLGEGVAEDGLPAVARGRLSPYNYIVEPEIDEGNFWVVRDEGPERREGFPPL